MDKLAQLSPLHYLIIIVMAIGVVLTMGLWDWRMVLIARIRGKHLAQDYGTQEQAGTESTTATAPVAATGDQGEPMIAMGRNDDNTTLTRNGGNVVLRARAELIARLLRSQSLYMHDAKGTYKRITQTSLIELATGLKPNGRAESDYGQLRAELEPLINPVLHIAAGQPHEQVIPK